LDLDWYETICRDYDPQTGRFLQLDALSFFDRQTSQYVFVKNNPIFNHDPLGLLSTPNDPQVLETVTVVGHRKKKDNAFEAIWNYIVNKFKGDDEKANQSIENNTLAKVLLFPLSTHTPLSPPSAMAEVTPVDELETRQNKQLEEEAQIAMFAVPELGAEEIAADIAITEAGSATEEAATAATEASAKASQKLLPNAFNRFSQLEKHFLKHAGEWGLISKEMYYKRAIQLMEEPIEGNIVGFTNKAGYTFKMNLRTGEFGVMRPNGVIETFFRRLKDAEGYWKEQIIKYGK
jgi:hypothetical protein